MGLGGGGRGEEDAALISQEATRRTCSERYNFITRGLHRWTRDRLCAGLRGGLGGRLGCVIEQEGGGDGYRHLEGSM